MGRATGFQPHKLIVAALFAPSVGADRACSLVEDRFGPIDDVLPAHRFTISHYYEREMGTDLHRALYSVEAPVDPSRLVDYKEWSNEIERDTADDSGARRVNLDPGLLSLSRVILATTKASAHRVPLRDGLYAEITLIYRRGRYAPLEWTYPDFESEPFVEWLARVRARYHEQLRAIDPDRPWRL